MSKTTFLGYVPSLKSKHEATIVGHKAIESKGGSIRYTLQGEYQGRKTLPKTVSKADFESVYGFDAKEAEAVYIKGNKDHNGVKNPQAIYHQVGKEDEEGFETTEIIPIENKEDASRVISREMHKDDRIIHNVLPKRADTVGSPSPASVEPPAPSESPFPQEPSNENFSAEDYGWVITHKDSGLRTDSFRTKSQAEKYRDELKQNKTLRTGMKIVKANSNDEAITPNILNYLDVKEAFGFGKKDEEESEEPKTQEFTVVLQEGDKLELTDVEEEQAAPDDENTEKEAETLEITDIDWETDDEDVDLPASVLVPSSVVEDEIADYLSDEYGFLVRGYVLNAETYEAVQAKVTRPVKEDETEDDEESEGLSTLAKVGLGVGALAVGAAIFGAEGEYPQEFLDEFYDFDSNPTADTQDEETLAIAYAAWLYNKRNEENIPYEAETDYTEIYGASGSGEIDHDRIDTYEETEVHFRHDYPMTTYDWTTSFNHGLTEDEEDIVDSEVRWDIGSEPSEGEDSDSIDVDGVGTVDYTKDTDYGDKRFYGLAAEHESESDGYAYAYTKGHEDGMGDEVIYRPRIATDKGRNIYKKILKQKAETTMTVEHKDGSKYRYSETDPVYGQMGDIVGHVSEITDEKETPYQKIYDANTVGNPSPSGPSSTPEPAEATGSEPSNENMEAEGSNMKMALGILGVGVGAVALLGGDRIKKLFDRFGL